ncbi:MAG: riboflavin biosynthesis protein RibF [Bacteroidales bacterium]|jgi:riboflavin kinase/FMN adenylyltransferase|nr:riboflavin biosynthesis protein RibF [Bacteroidales bacterium]MCI1784575.1 riboflavin biosynthesis protein RibF [Bacteroidales bacterium]
MVIATGFFDGVHLGHRFVLKRLVEAARERGDKSMVITFWPHPRNVLQDDARNLRLLTCLEEKKRMISACGVDYVEVIDFTKEFSRLSAYDYLKDYVIDRYGGKSILLGYDNRVGCDPGTPEDVSKIASGLGLEVLRTDEIDYSKGSAISSTKIRDCVSKGDIGSAEAMLGYRYGLFGVVVSGDQIGRKIGFPTANMQLYEPLKLIPGNGVYLVEVSTLGRICYGMCNIGIRPTVGKGNALTIETNIFDFDENIYGLDINISFIQRIREEKKFTGLPALQAQLSIDRDACMSLIERNSR